MGPFIPQLESALDVDDSTEEARGQINRSMGLGGCAQWGTDV